MKRIYTKKIAAALSIVTVLGMFSAAAVSADVTADFGDVCDRIDNSELYLIAAAKSKLTKIAKISNNSNILELAKKAGMSEEEVTKLLVASILPYYSQSLSEINESVNENSSVIKEVLGAEIDVDKWYDLFLQTKKDPYDSPKGLISGEHLFKWAMGDTTNPTENLTPVFETMDELMSLAMQKRLSDGEYKEISEKLNALNWTPDMIVAACRDIENEIDVANSAEYALLKASARYGTKLYIDDSEVKLSKSGMDLTDNTNIYTVSPTLVGDSLDAYITVMGFRRATNVVGYYSSDNNVVEIAQDESNQALTLNIKGEGSSDIIIKRDPLMKNDDSNNKDWLVKLRVVVGNEIGNVTKPVWDTVGKLSWEAADNAAKYKITLYKDGTVMNVYETTATDYDFSKIAVETGKYTATVQAFGANDKEYGLVSELSDVYDVKAAIEKVKAPMWDVKTDKKLVKWTGVENAVGYVVRIYKGDALIHTSDAVTGEEYDVTSVVAEAGSYYATVQAVGAGELKGSESDKSSVYVVTPVSSVKGNVKLQGVMVSGVEQTRNDNSGIKVVIKSGDLVIAETTTDTSGDYEFNGLPYNDSYTVVFEHKAYLKTKITATRSGDGIVAQDALMLYGDLNGNNAINIVDITRIISLLNTEDVEGFDIDDNNRITISEFGTIVRNLGKSFID